jgi:hypothetical protein
MAARLLLATVLVAMLVAAGWWLMPRQTQAPSETQTQSRTQTRTRTLTVTAVSGRAERKKASGPASPLKIGDVLSPDEVLRTLDGGTVALAIGEDASIEVADDTEVSLGELTDTLSRLTLAGGRVKARVHGREQATLEVEAPGASAVASSRDGEFSVLARGSHAVVASERGQVRITAQSKSVLIGAGQLSTVERSQAPSAPSAIPATLFLKLGKPRALTQREKQTEVKGETAPGAIVSVGGVRIAVGADGTFGATVPLAEGENDVQVVSEDVLGRRERAPFGKITVDSRAPEVRSQVKW